MLRIDRIVQCKGRVKEDPRRYYLESDEFEDDTKECTDRGRVAYGNDQHVSNDRQASDLRKEAVHLKVQEKDQDGRNPETRLSNASEILSQSSYCLSEILIDHDR